MEISFQDAELMNILKAKNLANMYYDDYQVKLKAVDLAGSFDLANPKKYVEQCESLVTPFLFQSPDYEVDYLDQFDDKEIMREKRLAYYKEFEKWNPNKFVVI